MILAIQALGRIRIQAEGTVLCNIPKKTRALLVYLAMQDGAPVTREKLADLLWPYHRPEKARHSLRNCLTEFRKACPSSYLITDFTSCRVMAETDVQQFASLAASDERQDLEAALNLYRGDLLEEFDIESEPWREWQTSEREGLREIAIHVAQRLTRMAYIAGEHEQAIQAGRRAVHLDSFNESSQRALMQAYAGAHQRGAAIRQYRNFEKLMHAELGTLPDDETRALRDQYRRRPPRSMQLRRFDELRQIAGKFTLALEGHIKLDRLLVRKSVDTMLAAADAGYELAHAQSDPAQPIAA